MTKVADATVEWMVESTYTTAEGSVDRHTTVVRTPLHITQAQLQRDIRARLAVALTELGQSGVQLSGEGEGLQLGRAWMISPTPEDIKTLRQSYGDDGIWVGQLLKKHGAVQVLYLLPTVFSPEEWLDRERHILERQLKRRVADLRQFVVQFDPTSDS